jgi:hypothetical protein
MRDEAMIDYLLDDSGGGIGRRVAIGGGGRRQRNRLRPQCHGHLAADHLRGQHGEGRTVRHDNETGDVDDALDPAPKEFSKKKPPEKTRSV